MIDVQLEFRVEHGADDWYEVTPLLRVGPGDSGLATPTWPDASAKGDLLVAPALISGFARYFAVDGAELGAAPIPARLVFLDDPCTTYAEADLAALVPTTLEVVGAGYALAGAAPDAVLSAAVQEVAP